MVTAAYAYHPPIIQIKAVYLTGRLLNKFPYAVRGKTSILISNTKPQRNLKKANKAEKPEKYLKKNPKKKPGQNPGFCILLSNWILEFIFNTQL